MNFVTGRDARTLSAPLFIIHIRETKFARKYELCTVYLSLSFSWTQAALLNFSISAYEAIICLRRLKNQTPQLMQNSRIFLNINVTVAYN